MTRRLADDAVLRGEEGARDGREDKYGNEHESRNGGENGNGNGSGNRSGNGSKNGDQSRNEGGGERESVNLRSGTRGGSKTLEGGKYHRVISNRSRRTRLPSETVVSC